MTAKQFVLHNYGTAKAFGPYELEPLDAKLVNKYHPLKPPIMLKDFALWCFHEGYQSGLVEASQLAQDDRDAIDMRRWEA